MHPPRLPKKRTVGRTACFQCESLPYFGEKPQSGRAKSDNEIVEELEGIEQGIYIVVERPHVLEHSGIYLSAGTGTNRTFSVDLAIIEMGKI